MENATKALMIAGAVLIAIMIISVGMMIFSAGNGVVQNSISGLSETEISSFNSKLDSYQGTAIRGTNVKQMLSTVITLNSQNRETYPERLVQITYETETPSDAENDISGFRKSVVSGATYNVDFTYTSGLITGITITKNTANNNG